jgi:chemotaxis signal transduction protein
MPQSLPETVMGSGYLRCSRAGTTYGVPLSRVRSVDRPEQIEWNPQSSSPDGWLPSPTGRVPIYSISQVLQVATGRESFGALVRIAGSDGGWALGFDRVERFDTQVEEKQIQALPALIRPQARSVFRGVVASGEDVVLCLDVDRLAPQAHIDFRQPPPAPVSTRSGPAPSKPSGNVAARQAQVVRFSLPGFQDSFALSARQVIEFVTTAPATAIPRAHASLPGIVIWRDQAVPVLDLGLAMGLTARPVKLERLLIVQVNGETGLIAIPTGGAMPRLQNANDFRSCPDQAGFPPQWVRGVFEDAGGRMAFPDLDTILHNPAAV